MFLWRQLLFLSGWGPTPTYSNTVYYNLQKNYEYTIIYYDIPNEKRCCCMKTTDPASLFEGAGHTHHRTQNPQPQNPEPLTPRPKALNLQCLFPFILTDAMQCRRSQGEDENLQIAPCGNHTLALAAVHTISWHGANKSVDIVVWPLL